MKVGAPCPWHNKGASCLADGVHSRLFFHGAGPCEEKEGANTLTKVTGFPESKRLEEKKNQKIDAGGGGGGGGGGGWGEKKWKNRPGCRRVVKDVA